jgi:chaperone_ClpB: ATP-dependent chaperone protein ClpB
MAREGNWILW